MRIKKGLKENLNASNAKQEFKINNKEFSKLNFIEKNEKIRDIIKKTTGLRNSVKSKDLLKIIDYIDENRKDIMVINKDLLIKKDGEDIVIEYRKGKIYLNIAFFIVVLIMIAVLSTYAYLLGERLLSVNKDINNDGIPELNIDTDGDGVADINIDDNFDNKPDYNINYLNNGEALFNVKVKNGYRNIINQDTNGDGNCDLNCDINEDGWPEMNLDINGDGAADLFVDAEYKGFATLNIDINGDKKCDINCDTDEDNKCDEYCLDFEVIKYIDIKNGNVQVNINTAIPTLEINGNEIECHNLYPTDQPETHLLKECKGTFTVENTSSIEASYNLRMVVDDNSFTSDNLKYKLISNNGISNIPNYIKVPKVSTTVLRNIKINAKDTHNYDVSFIIEGTGDSQNYDTGKNLQVKFVIET